MMTPQERSLRAKIAANTSWANTEDRSSRTAKGRAAFLDRFERQVDPDGKLDERERAQRAEYARKAHFQRLALASAASRRKKAEARRAAPPPEPTPTPNVWQPNDPLERAVVHAARSQGWNPTNAGEARLALCLHNIGFRAGQLREQHKVGRYRLDFADPDAMLAIESDGWVHTARNVQERDAVRDAWLVENGWEVVRIDVDGDIPAQLAEAFQGQESRAS